MTTLTLKNAHTASTIININNPEWGSKRFDFHSESLPSGPASSVGSGCNSSVLFDEEFKFWAISSYKK